MSDFQIPELPEGVDPDEPTTDEDVIAALKTALPTKGELYNFLRSSAIKVAVGDLGVQQQRLDEELAAKQLEVAQAKQALQQQIEQLKAIE